MPTETHTLPSNVPVCPVRGSVIYPTMVQHIDASRAISIGAIEAAMASDKVILIVSQKDKDIDDPKGSDLYDVGTACNVLRVRKNPDGTVQMLVSAVARVSASNYTRGDYLSADITPMPTETDEPVELQALSRELRERFEAISSAASSRPRTCRASAVRKTSARWPTTSPSTSTLNWKTSRRCWNCPA